MFVDGVSSTPFPSANLKPVPRFYVISYQRLIVLVVSLSENFLRKLFLSVNVLNTVLQLRQCAGRVHAAGRIRSRAKERRRIFSIKTTLPAPFSFALPRLQTVRPHPHR